MRISFLLLVTMVTLLHGCGPTPRAEAEELWGSGRPCKFTAQQVAALHDYFEQELAMSVATLDRLAAASPIENKDEQVVRHHRALAFSSTEDLSRAKKVALGSGKVRQTADGSGLIGGPWLGRDFAIISGSYPGTRGLLFRLDQADHPDLWPVLEELARMRPVADAATARIDLARRNSGGQHK